jgi:hypothetical protein
MASEHIKKFCRIRFCFYQNHPGKLQNDEKFLFFKDDKNKTECGLKPFDASMEMVPTPSPFHHLILNP